MKKELIKFITGTERTFLVQEKGWDYFITTQEATESIIYIYLSRTYNKGNPMLEFGGKYEFAGFYNKKDGEIYCCTYHLSSLLGDEYEEEEYGQGAMARKIKNLIEAKVCELIDNKIESLDRFTDKSTYHGYDGDLEYLKSYSKTEHAVKNILSNMSVDDVAFDWSYSEREISSSMLLSYITKGDEYITEKAVEIIENKHKQIRYQFEKNKIVKETMIDIINDKEHPVHFTKRVQDAMKTGDYKTVNVTTIKDGKECTFKIDAICLSCDNTFSYYSSYNIVAKDRETFYKTYGKHADFRVKDIEKITYGKKVIYTK